MSPSHGEEEEKGHHQAKEPMASERAKPRVV
jgi:hypothetical protein